MESKKIILIFFIFIFGCSFSQDIEFKYLGGGYNLSYSALRGFNRFVDIYNKDSVKIGGSILDEKMDYLTTPTGKNLAFGLSIGDGILDISYTKRRDECSGHYSIPEEHSRDFLYKTGTLGFGYLLRSDASGSKLELYYGLHLDFSRGKLFTMLTNLNDDWVSVMTFGNFAFTPCAQIFFHPFNGPVFFGARAYWQMNWGKVDFSPIHPHFDYTYAADVTKPLKSSGGNIGIMFQVFVNPFKIKLPERKIEPDVPVLADVNLSGLVKDAGTNAEIGEATIKIEKFHEGQYIEIISTKTGTGVGSYEVTLPRNARYRISVEAFGYDKKSEEFELNDYSPQDYKKDFLLPKFQVGQTIVLKNIYFKKASAELLSESYPELDKLYKFMNMSPTCEIEIAGHTSSEGNDDYNLKLSQDRAQSVVNYLKGKGIADNRMVPRGYGEKMPIADNDTEEGKELNRRVEFKILKQ
ncbi:MAG: hypothetical protein A2W91_18690 [Bacteroidetes bacterium GWF2_38_335]|nr:MAG: hypothetical protein A2W91_18690 [Bacteroidetes bacterium GWF2_38_335]OFY78169.1 MAG: hypothetical protein A2281_04375 [Bacteroidetes bacterium RIFOXYA12_FULL_38_20]HBS88670.1 hypothetical protein [Bacteroidales bacterium]